jgi:molybdenum storage protein
VFSIGLDLALPTGALAQLSMADSLGTAHMLGALLSPVGVVAIPPEILGHLLPLFIRTAPGIIFSGAPPYSMWEQPSSVGRIPPHRTDAGTFLLAECFGSETLTFVKDVDGVYDADPGTNPNAKLLREIRSSDLQKMNLPTLPFDRVVLDLLKSARLVKRFQVVNGLVPGRIEAALAGEHVGTLVYAG